MQSRRAPPLVVIPSSHCQARDRGLISSLMHERDNKGSLGFPSSTKQPQEAYRVFSRAGIDDPSVGRVDYPRGTSPASHIFSYSPVLLRLSPGPVDSVQPRTPGINLAVLDSPRFVLLASSSLFDFLNIFIPSNENKLPSAMSLESLVSRVNHLELQSPYGYTPSLAPSMAYLVVFSVLTLVHVILGIRYKYWVVFVTLVPGGIRELSSFGPCV
jgi:hypothetical protein